MADWIATRKTASGSIIHLWPDGEITWALGLCIEGSPHPRTDAARDLALRAGWLVMGEVELYDDDEVTALIRAARWAAARGLGPGGMRARLHAPVTLRPIWETLGADRSGRPTLRVWRLPRLRWPGLAVWHERGRYSVMREIQRSGTYAPTGVELRTLAEVTEYLLGA